MRGYKVFNSNWTCRGFRYEVGKIYEMEDEPRCCRVGFHFCKELTDCFYYYDFNHNNKVAIIEALGDIDEEISDSKCCTNKIKIVEELSWEKVLRLANSGDCNSGHGNSGDKNSGCKNSGGCNSGDYNSGNWNSGDCNFGNCNSGNRNLGNWNSRDYNSGNWNSGSYNSGSYNSGDWNLGDKNSGDWNITSYSNGCFNTETPNIFIFDKLSDLTYIDWMSSGVKHLLNHIPTDALIWVYKSHMTDEEKENNPTYKTEGGYLKLIKATNKDRQEWYDCLSNEEKRLILDMPNFDRDKFKKITGIDVGEV